MLSQIAGNPSIGDPFRARIVARRRAEVARVIERGIARGDLRPDADPTIATELLVGPVYFRLVFGGRLDAEFARRIAAAVFRRVRRRLIIRPGRPRSRNPARPDRTGPTGPGHGADRTVIGAPRSRHTGRMQIVSPPRPSPGSGAATRSISIAPPPRRRSCSRPSSPARRSSATSASSTSTCEGPGPHLAPGHGRPFRHRALFIGPNARAAVNEGRADYVPVFLSDVPRLFRSGAMPLDAVFVNATPPDAHGFCSLGDVGRGDARRDRCAHGP